MIVKVESVTMAADPAKVERIVENLLMNAARHTAPDRTIWLLVKASDGGVLVTVEDDGTGVPEELRERDLRAVPTGTNRIAPLPRHRDRAFAGRPFRGASRRPRMGSGPRRRRRLVPRLPAAGPLPAAAKTPTQVPAKATAPRRSGTAVAKTTVRSGGKAATARNGRRSTRTPAKDPVEASRPLPSGPTAG